MSKQANNCTEADIQTIFQVSKKNNVSHDITGLLLCTESHFFQYIEGDLDNIKLLYNKIIKDRRHTDCEIIQSKKIDQRLFPRWAMALRHINKRTSFISMLSNSELLLYNRILAGDSSNGKELAALIEKIFIEYQVSI